jgi:hypothetical protein
VRKEWILRLLLGTALCYLPLAACTARSQSLPTPAELLSKADAVAGWQRAEDVAIFGRDMLFDFMDGAADLYFTYGFQELAVARYGDGSGNIVQLEVYRTLTDADAYGLFTYNSYGQPAAFGVDGELESSYRLAFWQRRTFVQIVAQGSVDDETLRAFGTAVSSALPAGGERPDLVDALPEDGLQRGSVRFFREKMALDNFLWLGPSDVLGLSADTAGVVARYQVGSQEIDLLLVRFPEVSAAEAARVGLVDADLPALMGTDVKGHTLAATFGQGGDGPAETLLDQALSELEP